MNPSSENILKTFIVTATLEHTNKEALRTFYGSIT